MNKITNESYNFFIFLSVRSIAHSRTFFLRSDTFCIYMLTSNSLLLYTRSSVQRPARSVSLLAEVTLFMPSAMRRCSNLRACRFSLLLFVDADFFCNYYEPIFNINTTTNNVLSKNV